MSDELPSSAFRIPNSDFKSCHLRYFITAEMIIKSCDSVLPKRMKLCSRQRKSYARFRSAREPAVRRRRYFWTQLHSVSCLLYVAGCPILIPMIPFSHWLPNGNQRSAGIKSKRGPLGQDSLLKIRLCSFNSQRTTDDLQLTYIFIATNTD